MCTSGISNPNVYFFTVYFYCLYIIEDYIIIYHLRII